MGIKGFFRPTKEKIILLLIMLIAPIVNYFTGVNISTKITNVLFFPGLFFYTGGYYMQGDVMFDPIFLWIIITALIGLIWGYFLSCLIINLIHRIRSRN